MNVFDPPGLDHDRGQDETQQQRGNAIERLQFVDGRVVEADGIHEAVFVWTVRARRRFDVHDASRTAIYRG